MSRPADRASKASIDFNALKRAAQRLATELASEAATQNAYVAIFPDGRMSLELEWINPESIARAVIEAYLNGINEATNSVMPIA
jgi:hypothetical protein